MENQIPLNSSLPSSSTTQDSNFNEWTIVETQQESGIQKQLDEMKLQFLQLQKDFEHRQAVSDKFEFQAQIAQMQESYDSKIDELQEFSKYREKEMGETVRKLKVTNFELNAKVCKCDREIQKLQSDTFQLQKQLAALTTKKDFLQNNEPTICKTSDIIVDGKIDYNKLNGKILQINKLEQTIWDKWVADGYNISFDNFDFKVHVQNELTITSDYDIVFSRVSYSNLKLLRLQYSFISYATWKKLLSSCNNIQHLCLYSVTIKDENHRKIVEIDELWKDVLEKTPNVEMLEYCFKEFEVKTETCWKLAQLPPFSNLRSVNLRDIYGSFNLKDFAKFIKKNPNVKYELCFSGSNMFYTRIKNAEKEVRLTLPPTCDLYVDRLPQCGYY